MIRKFNRDEHAHTDIPDRGSESVEALESDSRRWEGLGAPSDDPFLRRSSMEHWNVRPVVKEIAKGSARIAISAWMFTCLLFSACECIVIVASDFLGRASALPHHHHRVLAPSAKVGFAVAAILAILQGLYQTYRRKRSDNPRIGIVIWPG